jgi:glucose-6-phosphate 1-epimerase
MPALRIECADGSALLYLQGAHVTSWVPRAQHDVLFVSEAARFAPGESIRGGVPVAFPQFAELGPLPMHGFAHTSEWQWSGSADAGATLTLADSDATRALWPHRFVAELAVQLGPGSLTLAFSVANRDRAAFDWAGTLHTFVALDTARVALRGLGPGRFIDRAHGSRAADDTAPVLRIGGHTDRAYLDAGPEVTADDGKRRVRIGKTGFRDTVIWNPGPETSARFPDLQADDHRRFVCIEAAEVRPVTVPAGATWRGTQVLRVAGAADPP